MEYKFLQHMNGGNVINLPKTGTSKYLGWNWWLNFTNIPFWKWLTKGKTFNWRVGFP